MAVQTILQQDSTDDNGYGVGQASKKGRRRGSSSSIFLDDMALQCHQWSLEDRAGTKADDNEKQYNLDEMSRRCAEINQQTRTQSHECSASPHGYTVVACFPDSIARGKCGGRQWQHESKQCDARPDGLEAKADLKVEGQEVVLRDKDEAVQGHNQERRNVGQGAEQAAGRQERVGRWKIVFVDGKGDKQKTSNDKESNDGRRGPGGFVAGCCGRARFETVQKGNGTADNEHRPDPVEASKTDEAREECRADGGLRCIDSQRKNQHHQ